MTAELEHQETVGVIRSMLESVAGTIAKIDEKIVSHGERLASVAAKLEQVAMKADLAVAIETHRSSCAKNKVDLQSYAKSIGMILGAIGVLVGAIAAAYGFTR